MKKLKFNFGLLYTQNIRSLHYLDVLKKNNIIPSLIIDFPNNKISRIINKKHKIEITKKKKNYNYFKKITKVIKIKNDKNELIDNFAKSNLKYFIFAGNYGQILPKEFFLLKKKIIHVHPGDLPYFKGSTTHYYEYLKKNTITYTSIFLNKYLDSGKILIKNKYDPNKINLLKLDNYFDPFFRAQTLLKTLRFLTENKHIKKIKKNKKLYRNYYVIHPLLKYLAILKSKTV